MALAGDLILVYPLPMDDDSEELKQRLQKILQGAFSGPPTPLKDIPTRHGESRKLHRPSGKKALRLLNKQLAPAVRADVAFDEFARIRRLEVSAALAALVALRRVLIVGGRLADLHLRGRL